MQAIANSYGKELTMEQAQELFDKIQSLTVSDDKLSDDMLEAVTGGGIIATVEEWFTAALPALFRWGGPTMADKKNDAKPEERLSDADLKAVMGGAAGSIRKRDVHGKPLTSGPEGYIVPLK